MKSNNSINDRMDEDVSIKLKARSDEWLVSYSDLVTVLLCFFIMFFVIKAREQEKSFQAMLKGPKDEHQQKLLSMSQELNSSLQNQRLSMKMFDNHIGLNVNSDLFEETGDELTLDGKYRFTQIAAVSFRYMPSVALQLSIATDGKKMDERSQRRINNIREYLVDLGLQAELVTLGSYPRSIASEPGEVKDEVRIFISKNYNMVTHEN